MMHRSRAIILSSRCPCRNFFKQKVVRSIIISSKSLSSSTLFIAGHGWTGAFGNGPRNITSPETSDVSSDDRDNKFKVIDDVKPLGEIVNAAAGWGHTALICKRDDEHETKLYVAGRPFDFQALLRLYRLPSFIRRIALSMSLKLDEQSDWGLEEKIISKLSGNDDRLKEYRKSVLPYFEEMKLPNGDIPLIDASHHTLATSAGFTAVIGKSGTAYTFGLNRSGQCGVGDESSVHIWTPTPIDLYSDNDKKPIVTDVALGLQHGLVLDESGSVYTFGKGSRGQLGSSGESIFTTESKKDDDFVFSPVKIQQFNIDYSNNDTYSAVTKISAGWNHSAVVTKNNHAWIWGKNVVLDYTKNNDAAPTATDSLYPLQIKGLPALDILDISCGSHHTSILMEDGSVYATGISTDTNEIIGGQTAVQIIPPSIIDMPVRQFKSHFDRTTIIAGENGKQILEVQLWSNEKLREEAVFEPSWVENIFDACDNIKLVHRGWFHTIIIGNE